MRIHRIGVRETNCYLLQAEGGTILIDPGPPGVGDKVIAGAAEADVGPGDVRLILISHGHLDHYGAAEEIQAWCGAPVAAHRGEAAFTEDRRNALPPAQTLRGSLVRWVYLLLVPLARFPPLGVDVELDDGAELSDYGLAARVKLVPGHSPGSLAVVTPDRDVFVGDLLVNYAVPSQPLYLSDREAWQRSYEGIRSLEPRTVYVGHGEPFPGDKLGAIYPARYQLRWWVR
jgi:glyoxylase-like metal-dependent hydrolase (beta-lactamase superfamily II)